MESTVWVEKMHRVEEQVATEAEGRVCSSHRICGCCLRELQGCRAGLGQGLYREGTKELQSSVVPQVWSRNMMAAAEGPRGRARDGGVRCGDTCFKGFIGWTTEVGSLPGMERDRMGSKSRGRAERRVDGHLDSVSGVCRVGVPQGTQGRRNGSKGGEGRRTSWKSRSGIKSCVQGLD